jgi:alkylhydroperoxidase family enzyme
MGRLAALSTADVIDAVLGDGLPGHDDVRRQMNDAHAAAWAATSPRLLELCRVRIAMLLGCDAEVRARTPEASGTVDDGLLSALAAWPGDPRFDPLDRACLAMTEHYVMDVATLDDVTVEAVRSHLGDEGLSNFVSALLIVEQRIRLRLMWDRLLGGS